MNYKEFLKQKIETFTETGFEVNINNLNPNLFDFQKDIVKWALKKGRAAIFADTGLGKTIMQLVWANQITIKYPNSKVLVVAPLAVSLQTQREGKKFDIDVNIARNKTQLKIGINITNYEILNHFEAMDFIGIVLDESSILKSFTGANKQRIIDMFNNTPYKLACTATPSPNDTTELLNHAEFLNAGKRVEILSEYFVHDSGDTAKWRLKGHAEDRFWQFVSDWAIAIKKPEDHGYKWNSNLPELLEHNIIIETDRQREGELFYTPRISATNYHKEKRNHTKARAEKIIDICKKIKGQIVIWCDTNYEADELKNKIPDSLEIRGSDSIEKKEQGIRQFLDNEIKVLISKPKIFGFGLNLQNCHNVIYFGLNYSFESYYQSVRRFWRYGQKHNVNIYRVLMDVENDILKSLQDKSEMHKNLMELSNKIKYLDTKEKIVMKEKLDTVKTESYEIINGDCIEEIKDIQDESIDFTIFSPPFSNLYVYNDDIRDLGNSKDYKTFFKHFKYLIPELFRIMKDGRNVSIHCFDIPLMKERDGFIGLYDFPGDIIRIMQKNGFIYHSKHIIWKDPLIEATRTKTLGLLHKQIVKDSAMSRAGLPDYLITFRKPGENTVPIKNENGFQDFIGINEPTAKGDEYSHQVWRKYANPVWMDIRQTYTLNTIKPEKDERHICPLQLDVIARAIELWSNEKEIIFSPFAGIMSEGYQAIMQNRKFKGIELKREYFLEGIKNLNDALSIKKQHQLF